MIVHAYPVPVHFDELAGEPAVDADAESYLRNARTMKLADFECPHGRLEEEDCDDCKA